MSKPGRIHIAELVRHADAQLAARQKAYPGEIANGRITREAADHALQAQRQIVDILVLFQRFEGAFRELALRKLADIREIHRHPAVENVLEVFPDAEIFVRDLPTYSHEHEEHPEP
ncbi:MAG: hypothetical protein B7Y80_01730 [Hyphomicrobium sp. 32-62-53]|nr:MAG: hypothetical protein B7Z29_02080 [Hyphomicrobium sp. 12-62-95]OYY01474.1 MAG: hypothetical protein B7Y80_01730 [Hyphomicrobium sp. 32-62-53]